MQYMLSILHKIPYVAMQDFFLGGINKYLFTPDVVPMTNQRHSSHKSSGVNQCVYEFTEVLDSSMGALVAPSLKGLL